jgi:hypothetical protein
MPLVGHADSITNNKHGSRLGISDWSSSNPVTRVIKVTLPTPTISLYIIIHTSIHAFIPYTHAPRTILPELQEGSGVKALRMQSNASQRFVLRHEVSVASFNMSNDRLGCKGQPTKGSRLPRVKQSQGRKHRRAPSSPRPVCREVDKSSQPSHLIPNLCQTHRISIEGEASGPPELVSGMTQASTGLQVKEQWNVTRGLC